MSLGPTSTVRVTLNGTSSELPSGSTVADALAVLGIAPDQSGVAVAVGDTIVRRADWARTRLADGDAVEVVTAAQGG